MEGPNLQSFDIVLYSFLKREILEISVFGLE